MTSLPLSGKIITMIDKRADQFAGAQCAGAVLVFWHETGPTPLHGWYWRASTARGQGPFTTSRGALLDAIMAGYVHEN